MNRLLQNVLVGSAVAILLAGCTQGADERHYINVSDAELTFMSDGAAPMVVEVSSSDEFKVESGADWINVVGPEDNILTVTVEPNDMDVERHNVIKITSSMCETSIKVRQLASEGGDIKYYYLDECRFSVVSPGGKYIAGIREDMSEYGEWIYIPVFINLETGERTELEPITSSQCNVQGAGPVSDNGVLFLYNASTSGSAYITVDGEFGIPPTPPTPEGIDKEFTRVPCINGVSADGSIWTGYHFENKGGFMYRPYICINGEPQLLDMPEVNFNGNPWITGVLIEGCSADGKVIYGRDFDTNIMMWWDGNNGYACDWVDADNRMSIEAERFNVSPNGEWLAGSSSQGAAFFNTVEKTTYFASGGGQGIGATNTGLGFVYSGGVGGRTNVYDIRSNTLRGGTQEWIKENYEGITVGEGYLEYMCSDNFTLMGCRLVTHGVTQGEYRWYVTKKQ